MNGSGRLSCEPLCCSYNDRTTARSGAAQRRYTTPSRLDHSRTAMYETPTVSSRQCHGHG